jgi:predicted nucleic acid-binding protein
VPVTAQTHASGLALARDHGLSFYDALIVASALEADCDTLYSEDMQDGRRVPGLTIISPFET